MSDYNKLLEFWNNAFNGMEASVIDSSFIEEESFNNVVNEYLKNSSTLLDFGCGSGWATFDLAFKMPNCNFVGVDPSINAINYGNECVKKSNLKNIEFKCLEEDKIDGVFDSIISFNVLDVLPNDKIVDCLESIKKHIKKGGYLVLGINPDYPLELLLNIGYELKDRYLFKDGILRGNLINNDEWIKILSTFFEFVELREISISEQERKYPRRVFICKGR